MDIKTLAVLAELTAEELYAERERLQYELGEMIRKDDHPKTIDATVAALGLVEAAAHIASALDRSLSQMAKY